MFHSSPGAVRIIGQETRRSLLDSMLQPEGMSRAFGRKGRGAYLRDECNKFSEVMSLLVWIYFEDLTDAIIVVPLLQKFLFVGCGVPFDEIL